MTRILAAGALLLAVFGCNSGELSNEDVARTKAELARQTPPEMKNAEDAQRLKDEQSR